MTNPILCIKIDSTDRMKVMNNDPSGSYCIGDLVLILEDRSL